jgi:8-oxo-dGTP pyrophosphatase MutT (NUDIX family)
VRWTVHGERALYESEWVRLTLADVELPDGSRLDHHVVRIPREAAGAVVHDARRGVLLLYRHRFVTDSWGWEIPAGEIGDGEMPQEAAARETLGETGWRPGALTRLAAYHPFPGRCDVRFHLFTAAGAEHVGEPEDAREAERVEWVPLGRVKELIRGEQIGDGLSLTALLWALTFRELR